VNRFHGGSSDFAFLTVGWLERYQTAVLSPESCGILGRVKEALKLHTLLFIGGQGLKQPGILPDTLIGRTGKMGVLGIVGSTRRNQRTDRLV